MFESALGLHALIIVHGQEPPRQFITSHSNQTLQATGPSSITNERSTRIHHEDCGLTSPETSWATIAPRGISSFLQHLRPSSPPFFITRAAMSVSTDGVGGRSSTAVCHLDVVWSGCMVAFDPASLTLASAQPPKCFAFVVRISPRPVLAAGSN
jgi:hypothetical protein